MTKSRAVSVFLVWVLLALATPGLIRAEKPTETVVGVIKAAETYKGKVQSVYIKDPEKGSFLVIRSTPVGKALLRNVGVTVKATGHVRKSRPESEFERVIDVLDYEIVSKESPEAPPAEPKSSEPGR